ncbi:hypothetical protein FOL47_010592 [Perkinsus chesapeaki]|uniref:UEV domain-containing protein n=1 Tax=Perkinsus chesapeaki TaxID=330153 RepID=A0A7J6L162_PERCH|nr:hypothetical protein FOL47_010592 [Perkinsus chesapeaki]
MYTSGYSPHEHLFSRLTGIYPNLSRLRQDITSLLQTIQSLRPNVGVFGSGRNQVQLFYLYGTVPIVFSGATYNIPMTIYFDPPYPSVPPRCFVSPTAGMSIKPRHQHVDHNGMVYLPYLNAWSPYSSTLPELVTIIASTFSADPPVYSSGPQQQQQQQPQTIQPVNGPKSTVTGQAVNAKVGTQGSSVGQNSVSYDNNRRQNAYTVKLHLQQVEDRTTELIEKTREYTLARESAATAVKEVCLINVNTYCFYTVYYYSKLDDLIVRPKNGCRAQRKSRSSNEVGLRWQVLSARVTALMGILLPSKRRVGLMNEGSSLSRTEVILDCVFKLSSDSGDKEIPEDRFVEAAIGAACRRFLGDMGSKEVDWSLVKVEPVEDSIVGDFVARVKVMEEERKRPKSRSNRRLDRVRPHQLLWASLTAMRSMASRRCRVCVNRVVDEEEEEEGKISDDGGGGLMMFD